MKPFNLEEALTGKPVFTRNGKKVTEIYQIKTAHKDSRNILAVSEGEWFGYYDHGGLYNDRGCEHKLDLFMAEEEKEMCVICHKEEVDIDLRNYCLSCVSKNSVSHIVTLAKRIKALEEKLK